MISEKDKREIIRTASHYGAKRVLLFGSGADVNREGADIDMAVEGVSPGEFFKFYGELMAKVSKPVDLVDLSQANAFTRIIRQEGVVIYDQSEPAPPG